jgi:hypothetical protein
MEKLPDLALPFARITPRIPSNTASTVSHIIDAELIVTPGCIWVCVVVLCRFVAGRAVVLCRYGGRKMGELPIDVCEDGCQSLAGGDRRCGMVSFDVIILEERRDRR